jgi:hypothetical protein
LLVLLAIIFVIEAWLWDHLKPVIGWFVSWVPWERFKARIASAIEHLPPYATLLVFVIPPIILFPLKLLGIWMLAHGFWLGALAVLALAKLVGMGVAAFIFEITRPKLLQIGWFRRFYERVLVWLEWAHGLVDPIKVRIKRVFRMFGPGRAGRTLRLLSKIRRRVRGQAAA